MEATAHATELVRGYPARIIVDPVLDERNRVTTLFRFFLALPHLLLVGGPAAVGLSVGWQLNSGLSLDWGGATSGLLGAVAAVVTMISWFAILITGTQPDALRRFAIFYLRWRARAVGYLMLLTDEYPPFNDDEYDVELEIDDAPAERDLLTIAFRIILVIPHMFLLWVLGIVWAFGTAVAWVAILLTGRYPEALYGLAIGILAWGFRVESYLLLLHDEYPPFTLRA